MADADTIIEGPVSYVITRKVKPKAVKDYEKWLLDVGDAARAVDPSLGMTVIKPGGHQAGEYVVVLHFSNGELLDEWEHSETRKELRRRVEPFEEGKASFSEVTGFEYWFSLPKVAAIKPPSRIKMALITVIGLYILSVIYVYTGNKWLAPLPDHLELIIRILVIVVLMTFVLMPLLSRAFARWLYPMSSRAGGTKSEEKTNSV